MTIASMQKDFSSAQNVRFLTAYISAISPTDPVINLTFSRRNPDDGSEVISVAEVYASELAVLLHENNLLRDISATPAEILAQTGVGVGRVQPKFRKTA